MNPKRPMAEGFLVPSTCAKSDCHYPDRGGDEEGCLRSTTPSRGELAPDVLGAMRFLWLTLLAR